jgi:hypothetical protein
VVVWEEAIGIEEEKKKKKKKKTQNQFKRLSRS